MSKQTTKFGSFPDNNLNNQLNSYLPAKPNIQAPKYRDTQVYTTPTSTHKPVTKINSLIAKFSAVSDSNHISCTTSSNGHHRCAAKESKLYTYSNFNSMNQNSRHCKTSLLPPPSVQSGRESTTESINNEYPTLIKRNYAAGDVGFNDLENKLNKGSGGGRTSVHNSHHQFTRTDSNHNARRNMAQPQPLFFNNNNYPKPVYSLSRTDSVSSSKTLVGLRRGCTPNISPPTVLNSNTQIIEVYDDTKFGLAALQKRRELDKTDELDSPFNPSPQQHQQLQHFNSKLSGTFNHLLPDAVSTNDSLICKVPVMKTTSSTNHYTASQSRSEPLTFDWNDASPTSQLSYRVNKPTNCFSTAVKPPPVSQLIRHFQNNKTADEASTNSSKMLFCSDPDTNTTALTPTPPNQNSEQSADSNAHSDNLVQRNLNFQVMARNGEIFQYAKDANAGIDSSNFESVRSYDLPRGVVLDQNSVGGTTTSYHHGRQYSEDSTTSSFSSLLLIVSTPSEHPFNPFINDTSAYNGVLSPAARLASSPPPSCSSSSFSSASSSSRRVALTKLHPNPSGATAVTTFDREGNIMNQEDIIPQQQLPSLCCTSDYADEEYMETDRDSFVEENNYEAYHPFKVPSDTFIQNGANSSSSKALDGFQSYNLVGNPLKTLSNDNILPTNSSTLPNHNNGFQGARERKAFESSSNSIDSVQSSPLRESTTRSTYGRQSRIFAIRNADGMATSTPSKIAGRFVQSAVSTPHRSAVSTLNSHSSSLSLNKGIIAQSGGGGVVSNNTLLHPQVFITRSDSRGSIASLTSLVSLASSTSYLSPHELQQLIEEANQSLDQTGVIGEYIIEVILLHREHMGGGIGITLAGGIDQEQKEIRIHKVISGSVADKDGRAQKGDRVLSINGKMMHNITHRQSVEVLKAPRPEVVLVLSRPKGFDDNSFQPDASCPSPPIQSIGMIDGEVIGPNFLTDNYASCTDVMTTNPNNGFLSDNESGCGACYDGIKEHIEMNGSPQITQIIYRNTGEIPKSYTLSADSKARIFELELQKPTCGLGISLEGGKGSLNGDKPITVKRIFQSGVERCGVLRVGDEILKINQRSTEEMSHFQAWNYLKSLGEGPLILTVKTYEST